MADDIIFIDNSAKVLEEFEAACLRALERCGLKGESLAKEELSKPKLHANGEVRPTVDTGNLRNSISHKVDSKEKSVYIGTNNEYAAYVELGTGKYAEGGRQDPWVYQDSEGKWHYTNGQKPQPYLKPAVANHTQTYRNIIQDELNKG